MTTDARPDVANFLALLNSMPKVDYATVTADMMRTMNVTLIGMAELEPGPLARGSSYARDEVPAGPKT